MSLKYIKVFVVNNGAPDRIRTYDLELRSLLLYPAELPGHGASMALLYRTYSVNLQKLTPRDILIVISENNYG